jgi:acetyl esterase
MDPSRWPSLDPELVPLVEMLPEMHGAMEDIPAAREMLASFIPTDPPEAESRVEMKEVAVGGTTARIYRPRGVEGDLPGLLHVHGGGFCLGSAAIDHPQSVGLADELQCVVATVDYRLAPEHPYPAGVDDAYAALELLAGLDGVDASRIAVQGQSAGGAIAAAVALLARDRRGPAIRFQVLEIPVLDDRCDTPSMLAHAATPLWSRPQAVASWEYYLGGAEADQYAAPARAEDLSGLPAAYVLTCELDPLRDEGIRYAARLLESGVSVELHNYPGAFHGSTMAQGSTLATRMTQERLGALRRALGTSP